MARGTVRGKSAELFSLENGLFGGFIVGIVSHLVTQRLLGCTVWTVEVPVFRHCPYGDACKDELITVSADEPFGEAGTATDAGFTPMFGC